jgi:hypothetical protein
MGGRMLRNVAGMRDWSVRARRVTEAITGPAEDTGAGIPPGMLTEGSGAVHDRSSP